VNWIPTAESWLTILDDETPIEQWQPAALIISMCSQWDPRTSSYRASSLQEKRKYQPSAQNHSRDWDESPQTRREYGAATFQDISLVFTSSPDIIVNVPSLTTSLS
jgi:hypothetical protein